MTDVTEYNTAYLFAASALGRKILCPHRLPESLINLPLCGALAPAHAWNNRVNITYSVSPAWWSCASITAMPPCVPTAWVRRGRCCPTGQCMQAKRSSGAQESGQHVGDRENVHAGQADSGCACTGRRAKELRPLGEGGAACAGQ